MCEFDVLEWLTLPTPTAEAPLPLHLAFIRTIFWHIRAKSNVLYETIYLLILLTQENKHSINLSRIDQIDMQVYFDILCICGAHVEFDVPLLPFFYCLSKYFKLHSLGKEDCYSIV